MFLRTAHLIYEIAAVYKLCIKSLQQIAESTTQPQEVNVDTLYLQCSNILIQIFHNRKW